MMGVDPVFADLLSWIQSLFNARSFWALVLAATLGGVFANMINGRK